MTSRPRPGARVYLNGLWSKRWLRVPVYLTIGLAAFLLVLPHTIRIGLERWFLNNGADQATIEKVRLNPFSGTVSLQGTKVVVGGNTVLSEGDVHFNIGLLGLFESTGRLQVARLSKVHFSIEQFEDGRWRVASYTTSPGEEKVSPEPAEDTSWLFQVDAMDMEDVTLHFKRPDFEAQLIVDQASLRNFYTGTADEYAELTLHGSLNGAPIAIQLDRLQVHPELTLDGSIETSQLQLNHLSGLLQEYLHPFSGVAGLNGTFHFSLTGQNSILVDYEGRLDLAEADLGGSGYALQGGRLGWHGQVKYRQDLDNSNAITIDHDGSLTGAGLMLNLPDQITLRENSLDIQSKTSITVDGSITVNSEGKIDFGETIITMPPYETRSQGFKWQGTAAYTSAGQDVMIDGNLDLVEPSIVSVQNDSSFTAGSSALTWQGLCAYAGNEQLHNAAALHLKGKLTGTGLEAALTGPDLSSSLQTLTFSSDVTIPLDDALLLQGDAGLNAQALLVSRSSSGEKLVSLDQLTVDRLHTPAPRALTVEHVQAGELDLVSPSDSTLQATIAGIALNDIATDDMSAFTLHDLSAQSLLATDTAQERMLASIKEININDIKADTDFNLRAASLSANAVTILDQEITNDKSHFLELARLVITSPEWDRNKSLNISSISLEDLQAKIFRDLDGKLLITQAIQELRGKDAEEKPPKASKAVAADKAGPTPAMHIGEVSVAGKSALRFEDHALKLPFTSQLSIDTLRIANIDSGKPDNLASYELTGSLDEYAPLAVSGTITPFADTLVLHQKSSIKNYPMTRLAPYSIQYLGIAPTQGTFGVEVDLSFAEGIINIDKTWLLKKLEIKTVDEQLAGEFNSQLPLPLDSALSLLKDKDDNIELSIPLNGPIDDLDFGITDFLITPLSKAIVAASSSYLLYALGPYGALAYVGLQVGGKLMETRLPAVEFAAGQSVLTEEHEQYLERIAEILKNRPKIDLQLCPYVLPAELLPGLRSGKNGEPPAEAVSPSAQEKELPVALGDDDKSALLKLGNTRALALKNYLVQAHDIDPGRLIICVPEMDKGKVGVPRVELKI